LKPQKQCALKESFKETSLNLEGRYDGRSQCEKDLPVEGSRQAQPMNRWE
jgi:hypothetical protein